MVLRSNLPDGAEEVSPTPSLFYTSSDPRELASWVSEIRRLSGGEEFALPRPPRARLVGERDSSAKSVSCATSLRFASGSVPPGRLRRPGGAEPNACRWEMLRGTYR